MRILILGENCLDRFSSFDKSIFSAFSVITSVYARQIAAVTPNKHFIEIPEVYDDINFDEKWDVVHLHFKTGTALRSYAIADKFREKGNFVLLSGSHPSALPEEAKEHADCVIVGSVEILWPEFLHDFEFGKIKPYYKQKILTKKNEFSIPNLTFPSRWGLIHPC